MKSFTSFLKLALLTVVFAVCHNAFAGGSSSSSLTVNVAETDTGKGYVYVSTERTRPADDQINEGGWWTTSSFPQNTMVDNDTHYYNVCGLATEGYRFAGIKLLIDEGVYGELITPDEEGFCPVAIECSGIANIAIYYAVFEEYTPVSIQSVGTRRDDATTYNLHGQQVGDKHKSIMIRNGQKIILQ